MIVELSSAIFQFVFGLTSTIFWCLYIFVLALIPTLLILGVLAYKSRPNKDSFEEAWNKFLQLGTSDYKNKFLGRFVAKAVDKNVTRVYHDSGLFSLGFISINGGSGEEKETHLLLGIFGGWYPLW